MAEADPIVTRDAEGPPTEDEARDQEIADAETPEQREEATALEPSAPIIDQTIARPAPAVGSATETTAATTQPPTTPQEAVAGAFKSGMAAADAAEDRGQAATKESDAIQAKLDQQRQDAEDERVRRQMDDQAAEDARNEFNGRLTAAQEKVRDFKFHDYFENPAHMSRALARFSVFLGGLGNLGGQAPGAPNRALDHLEDDIRRDHEDQLAYLNSAKYFADKQREGYGDLLKQQAVDRQEAELDYANKKIATADQFEALAQSARGKAKRDAAIVAANQLRKSAYNDQQKVFAEIHREKMDDARAAYLLSKVKHRGAGTGGGSSTGAEALAKDLEAHPEWGIGEQIEAAKKHGVPVRAKAGQVSLDTIKSDIDKKAGAQEKNDALTVIVDGKPIGLASSTRNVKAIEDRAVQFDDAIKSLEDLKEYVKAHPITGRAPVGDQFNRAALAVAATTTANSSDHTTHMETGTLKNLGVVSPEAIDRTLEHLKARQKAFLGQLRPIGSARTSMRAEDAEAPANPAVEQAQKRLQSLGAVRIE